MEMIKTTGSRADSNGPRLHRAEQRAKKKMEKVAHSRVQLHITTMGFRSVGRGAIQQAPEMTQVLTEWPGRFIPHLGSLSSGN